MKLNVTKKVDAEGQAQPETTAALGVHLTIPSDLRLIDPTIRVVEEFVKMRSLSVPRLSLVMTELIRNAVVHGNTGDVSRTVEITAQIVAQRLIRVSVKDQGEGFDWRLLDYEIPDSLRSLRQRGLLLAANAVHSIEFNDPGNCITIQMDGKPAKDSMTQTSPKAKACGGEELGNACATANNGTAGSGCPDELAGTDIPLEARGPRP